MNSKTTFRRTLIDELDGLANSREVDERLVQIEYIEEKNEVIGEFLDYYTDDLIQYKDLPTALRRTNTHHCAPHVREPNTYCFIGSGHESHVAW